MKEHIVGPPLFSVRDMRIQIDTYCSGKECLKECELYKRDMCAYSTVPSHNIEKAFLYLLLFELKVEQ